jgi:prophage DNA circulation protein
MSWEQNLQDASFRGVKFDVIRTEDGRQRAVARHEYPYVDGADLEDMGARERTFSLTAVLWGDDYDTRLQTLIKTLDQPGNGELIHPIYGSIAKAQLDDYRIRHDAENVDHCEVELHFSEATPGNPFFVQQLASQKAGSVGALGSTAQSGGFAAFAAKVSSIVSTVQGAAARLNALRNVMNYTMVSIQSQVEGVTTATLDVITFPLTFTSNVTSFLSAMADVPSFAVGTIMSDWTNFTGQLNNIASLPDAINSGTATTNSPTGMVNVGLTSSDGAGVSTGAPVASTAIVAAGANPADVEVVTAAVQLAIAVQLATTASGILADEASQPTLALSDIEQIVDDTRTSINTTIDQYRTLFDVVTFRPVTEALKDMASAIESAAIQVMNQAPQLTTRTVDVPGNLTLIAFEWYGDYTRADELLRLNPAIRNPNFVLPGTVLNAYVS